jgi:DNA-binding NarL/FixJ family response regulator
MKTNPTTPSSVSNESDKKIHRVYIVDDHPITRQGLMALINAEPDLTICGETDNAPSAIEQIQKLEPDVALIDVTLKTSSGIELIKHLKALRPQMPILMMSMHDESLFAERALRAGAKGYVMKLESSDTILAALRRTLSGEIHLSEFMRDKMLHRIAGSDTSRSSFSMDTLSDREVEVFQLLGNGYGTRQIAARLNLSVKTIDSYREHLKLKLRLDSGTELVRHAIQWIKTEGIG